MKKFLLFTTALVTGVLVSSGVMAMPPAIAGAAILAVGAAVGGQIAIAIGLTLVLGYISQALAPKPKGSDGGVFQQTQTNRLFEIQEPIAARQIVYGEQRKSGNRVFLESTEDNKFLHNVIVLASHEIEAIDEVFLNDDPIHDDDIDASGDVVSGMFAGKVKIKKHLGTAAQAADGDLVGIGGWTANHRLRGIAYLYVRLEFDQDLFPSSVPNISAWVRGKKVVETRDSAQPTQFSTNPALILRDYFITDADDMGMGFDAANEIDDTFTDSAANTCDQVVDTETLTKTVTSVDTTNNLVELSGSDLLPFQRGDKVDVTSNNTVPSGLGTGMYAIPWRRTKALLADDSVHANVSMKFASTYDDAIAGNAVSITDSGTGTISVSKVGEPRYTANGVVDSTEDPIAVVEALLAAMGGRAVHIGGNWKIYAAGYITPTISLDENDLRGPMTIQTRHSRRERFNAVKGVYVSPINNGVRTEYPPVTNSTYESQDNSIRLWKEHDLEFVSRAHQAQRLAKIELERHRQQLRVNYPSKLTAFQLQPTDTVQITNSRMGWTDKEFEVVEVNLVEDKSNNDEAPALVADLVLVETASGVYDWNSGEETLVDLAPNTNLRSVFQVGVPTGLNVFTDSFTDATSNAVQSCIMVQWSSPSDFYVTEDGKIEVQFKRSTATDWIVSHFVPGAETLTCIKQVEDGASYDIRVRSVNHVGVRSGFNTISAYVVGSSFDPLVGHIDWRFVTESVTANEDWGDVPGPAFGYTQVGIVSGFKLVQGSGHNEDTTLEFDLTPGAELIAYPNATIVESSNFIPSVNEKQDWGSVT